MKEKSGYTAVIKCVTCHEIVEVEAKKDSYDDRYVIICPRPECGKLAYNTKTPPPKKH